MREALVIDDHPVTHLGCRRLLADAGFESVLEARNCDEGYRVLERLRPELVILDLGLPGVGGLAMIPRLLQRNPDTKILVFSMHEDPVFAARALEVGAHGYLTKSSKPEDFMAAVEAICSGKIYLEHDMATQLAALKTGRSRTRFDDLTARELQILRLIGKGLSHGEIAEQLHVSYKTVANTATQLKAKLRAKSLAELIRIAIEWESVDLAPNG